MADRHDIDAHIKILETVMDLYVKRDEVHDGLWKKYGAKNNMLHVQSKAARMESLAERGRFPEAVAEAVDLINYTLFFIRNVGEDRL